MENEHTSEYQF